MLGRYIFARSGIELTCSGDQLVKAVSQLATLSHSDAPSEIESVFTSALSLPLRLRVCLLPLWISSQVCLGRSDVNKRFALLHPTAYLTRGVHVDAYPVISSSTHVQTYSCGSRLAATQSDRGTRTCIHVHVPPTVPLSHVSHSVSHVGCASSKTKKQIVSGNSEILFFVIFGFYGFSTRLYRDF